MDILYYCKHHVTLKWKRYLTVVPQQSSVIHVNSGVTMHIHKTIMWKIYSNTFLKPPHVVNSYCIKQ